ncbi:MAG: Uma2 family endonuclease [Thermoflexales bacterium]|nr:Uma2 family endonuclease [Thermoflexales bacterium]
MTVTPVPEAAAPERAELLSVPEEESNLETPLTLSPKAQEAYRRMMQSLVTEDDEPVDNLFSDKQQRLLAESLYASWSHSRFGRRFLAAANVGVFYEGRQTALVPDLLLSLDVEPYPNVWEDEGRSYFVWVYGKPPDVVVEVVSNRKGEELGRKAELYWRVRVRYYVVYDPSRQLSERVLQAFVNGVEGWEPVEPTWLPGVEIGLTLWQGEYEGLKAEWLRWCDQQGRLVLTGRERAELEQQRAEAAEREREAERQRAEAAEREREAERQRAEAAEREREAERQRAEAAEREREAERQRAERFAARLRALGVEPE